MAHVMAARMRIPAIAILLATAVAGRTAPLAHATAESQTRDPVLSGALRDDTGRTLAFADVQACSARLCLYGETDADGRFRFELPLRAAPFVIKTVEDVSAAPRRGAALAPVRLSGRSHIDLGPVYVPHLPERRPFPQAPGRQRMEAGDGLELTITPDDLVPPAGTVLVGLAARRIPSPQVPAYDLPGSETLLVVYAIHPFGATSTSPIGVKAPSTVPPGTPIRFRTIHEIDGTFSEPASGRATGTHVVTDASTGITELTHLVITAAP
jgi:hypothetical protein